jgi:hypothetical protein
VCTRSAVFRRNAGSEPLFRHDSAFRRNTVTSLRKPDACRVLAIAVAPRPIPRSGVNANAGRHAGGRGFGSRRSRCVPRLLIGDVCFLGLAAPPSTAPIPLRLATVWCQPRPDVQRRRRADHPERAERHPELPLVNRGCRLDLEIVAGFPHRRTECDRNRPCRGLEWPTTANAPPRSLTRSTAGSSDQARPCG